jgi:hypothetical protein
VNWQLTPTAIEVWTRLSHLSLTDRAEILARLADDVARRAIEGQLGLEFMAVARLREEDRRGQDGTSGPTDPDADSTPQPARLRPRPPMPRGRTKVMPRHQQFPRHAVDAALGRPQ